MFKVFRQLDGKMVRWLAMSLRGVAVAISLCSMLYALCSAADDIKAKLNDAVGVSKFAVQDSGNISVTTIDSDGNTVIMGSATVQGAGGLSVRYGIRAATFTFTGNASAPTAAAGMLYRNTGDNRLYFSADGTNWVQVGTGPVVAGGGGGWVGTATSDLNMATWNIINVSSAVFQSSVTVQGARGLAVTYGVRAGSITLTGSGSNIFSINGSKFIICNTFTSAGINAAITDLGANGGEVYLPEGTYTISAAVTILYNNTTLRGAGKGTILQQTAAVYGIDLNGKDYITVKDLQINGNAQNGFCIYGLGSTNCVLENLYIRGSAYAGIKMDSGSNYFKISQCEITGNAQEGIVLVGTTYGVIANNYISGNTLSGIFVYPATTQYNTISGNIIQGNTQSGIYIQDSYNVITGNIISGNSPNSDFDNVFLNAASYNTITGNEISNAGGAAVNTDGIELNSSSHYNTITGNVIRDNGADAGWNCAIDVQGSSNTIVGNLLKGTGTSGKSLEIAGGGNQIGGNKCLSTVTIGGTGTGFNVTGTLTKNAGTFKITHPLDKNKWLSHGFMEGPEYGVIYRGKATLKNATAVVELPDYFEALTKKENRTVQLTCIGDGVKLYVDGDVKDAKFIVKGDKDVSFYWQVQAERDDDFVRKNPFVLEESK